MTTIALCTSCRRAKNKDANQACSNSTADQRFCFRYTDSEILLLVKYKISSLLLSSVLVIAGLCGLGWKPQILFYWACWVVAHVISVRILKGSLLLNEPSHEKTNNLQRQK